MHDGASLLDAKHQIRTLFMIVLSVYVKDNIPQHFCFLGIMHVNKTTRRASEKSRNIPKEIPVIS